jgi:hypothetical protein
MAEQQHIEEHYLRITEELNALDFLEQGYHHILRTEKNDLAWKWVVICLHGALYGFAVSACRGTNSDSVVVKKLDNAGVAKREFLISFSDAMKRCQTPGRVTKPIKLTRDESESIRHLHLTFRNRFEHYQPCHWSIEIHGFPGMAIHALRVVERLATETSMFMHLEPEQRLLIHKIVQDGVRFLEGSKLYREGATYVSQ